MSVVVSCELMLHPPRASNPLDWFGSGQGAVAIPSAMFGLPLRPLRQGVDIGGVYSQGHVATNDRCLHCDVGVNLVGDQTHGD